jgi:steroid 5-alpha reductase family enzyme
MADLPSLLPAASVGLAAIVLLSLGTWLFSMKLADVSIVDRIWAVLIVLPLLAGTLMLPETGPRMVLVVTMCGLWAIRLATYITWRNWGEGEDHRYQEIRARNQPHFEWKSAYLVFGLQGLLAWIVSAPLLAAVASPFPLGRLDALGITLFVIGFLFETVGDLQLARFRSAPSNRGKVFDRGLWRYTRHPNYFGEFCIWWGFYLIALSGGGWWALVSPLLMSMLLLKVSGVTLLEKTIGARRPAYRDYVARTSAFFPWKPRA